jgi:NitT/TauT family transport system permease protein
VSTSRWPYRIVGYILFIALWQTTSTVSEQIAVPSPLDLLETMAEITTSGDLLTHFSATVSKIALGFAIAFVLGTALAVLMGRSEWWNAFFEDAVLLLLATPGLIFALLMAMIFGLSATGPIVAIIVTATPYVVVNVVEGVRAVPKELVDMSDSFSVSDPKSIRHVIIPSLAPFLFAALRYGFSISWKITTLTEVFGGTEGIGFMMRTQFQLFSMRGFLAWALYFFAFALLLEQVLQYFSDRFFRWRPQLAR